MGGATPCGEYATGARSPLRPPRWCLEDLRSTAGGRGAARGAAIDGYEVFLQVYLGYQYCPFTMLRLPWSDEPPRIKVVWRRVRNVVHLKVDRGGATP
jgi:hypothetical protein